MQSNKNIRLRARTFYHAYLRRPALRLCTDILQRTPLDSERFGPPKGTITSTQQWIENVQQTKSPGSRFTPVQAGERLNFVPIQTLEPEADFHSFYKDGLDSPCIHRNEAGDRYVDLPETFVAEIPGGRAFGCDGAIITPTDYLLQDLSPEYTANRYITGKHSVLAQMRLPKIHYVHGTVAVLATLSAQQFFAHWMMDMLPRIGLLEDAGISLDQIDKFFVNSPNLPYQRQTLEALGIPGSKIIDCVTHPHIKADCLVVPSPVSGVFASSSETCNFLRQRFLNDGGGPDADYPKRIYISRANTSHRRITNENEVINELSAYGFVAVEPQNMSLAQQSQLFAAADVIVMPLGSAMANTVYCHPNAKIIEILSPRAVQACTWAVCSQRGAEYYFMFAQGVNGNDAVLYEDMAVDVTKLTETLNFAGLEPKSVKEEQDRGVNGR